MISDAEARRAALDPNKSFIVQAPAGSGKTGLLVYRMLTLLALVEQPQQVLAITFTRKATAEMRDRLVSLLRAAKAGETGHNDFEQQGIDLAREVLTRDQQFQWNLLNTPHQLQILTIDSFCAKLTGSMPWLSRLGDRPRTTDQADAHYAAAVEQLLGELLVPDSAISTALQTVMLELDFNYSKARTLFSSMLAKRDQWLRHLLQHDLGSMRNDLEGSWRGIIEAQLETLTGLLPSATVYKLVALACHASTQIQVKEGEVSKFAAFENFDATNSTLGLAQWQGIANLLLTGDNYRKARGINIRLGFAPQTKEKEELLTLLDELSDDHQLRLALSDVGDLPDSQFSDTGWSQLLALESVLKSLAALLQLRFRAVGECDHSEVTQRANLALQELNHPTDLGLRMDFHLQHVLVDEFQDTSHGQVDLLKKLTAGWAADSSIAAKTLFLVGDPMQSVYRFREADVSLFLQVADNQNTGIFNNIEIEFLRLTENFRSFKNLVLWFNDTFKQSFPARNDVLTGGIEYAPATSQNIGGESALEYQLGHDKDQEATLLVEAVQQALLDLPNEQAQIAILVRSRSQLTHLLPVLQKEGIEYAGVDIQPLKELQAVIDVLALCRAICREDDRVAWLSLLRGPWCGLTLKDIKCLAGRRDLTVWQQLHDYDARSLTLQTTQRIKRFIECMSATLEQRQQVELSSLVRWAWRGLGGENTLYGAAIEDIESVFDLIEGLQRGGDLPSMRELDKALEGLYAEPDSGRSEAVPRVLISTIHKAKGLQYDTVILPGLGSSSRAATKEVLMWAELQNQQGNSQLLLAPLRLHEQSCSHYHYLRQLETRRSANEAVRLMYVACTRAERKLVLIATARLDSKTEQVKAPAKNTLLATVWPALESYFEYRLAARSEAESEPQISQTLSRLPSSFKVTFPRSISWQVEEQLNARAGLPEHHTEVEYEWATQVATGVGIVLHDWLQFNGSSILNTAVDQSIMRRWRSELLALNVPNNRIDYAVKRLVTAVSNIQDDVDAHFLFSEYAIEHNEYTLSAFEAGVVNHYRLDRTFVDEQGVRWIVDYKSTDTNNHDLQKFADDQVERHRAQLNRYGALMQHIDARPIMLAVYFPLLKQLRSWRYESATNPNSEK